VLSDPAKRQQYDNARMGVGSWSSPWGSPFATTIEDIFETFFGGAGATRTRQRTRAREGESFEIIVELSIDEVVFGGTRTLELERHEPCETCEGKGTAPGTSPEQCSRCEGTGQVQQSRRTILGSMVTAYPCGECEATGWIVRDKCTDCRGAGRVPREVEVPLEFPAGLDNGDRMRLDGEGSAGLSGGPRGDLYVRFAVTPDERFERHGDDLLTWAEVPMTIAALGGSITVETLDGEESIDIPSGTQSMATFRVRDRGVARRRGRGRGELIVRAHVVTPSKLSKKEKELLRELAKERGEDPKETKSVLRRALGLRDR
jgi:molecular chaperone DnaJ